MLSVSMDTLFIWGNRVAENILIVGNGFDLSHYLPTKYDHFMDVMSAIESSKNDEMRFDDLFAKCREEWFIAKTNEYYQTENIHLDKEQLTEIKALLKENSWYQYFKNHVQQIKTWIDFEQKIQTVLLALGECVIDTQGFRSIAGSYQYLNSSKDSEKIRKENFEILNYFTFSTISNYGKYNFNKIFCHGGDSKNGFSIAIFLEFLYKDLKIFIEIFNFYLEKIISNLQTEHNFSIQSSDWKIPSKIYSFNYTDTYKKIYKNVKTEYLHGKCGEQQNIVLGISDLYDNSLRELKAFGFTKYHQKLFKDTDYLFLDKKKEIVHAHKRKIEYFEKDSGYSDALARKRERQKLMEEESKLNLNIQIWGHSLDLSDQDYIKDIFSLNDDFDRNVRVVVYYYRDQGNSTKFSLLNNLLAILDKDKVEKWMKKEWLKFKPNPQIDFKADQQQQIA